MRPSPLLLALVILVAACGGNSTSDSKCPARPCPTEQTCQADGTCATAIVTLDGGIAACTSGDVKPVVQSTLPGAPGSGAYVLLHAPSVKVGQTISFDVPSGIASITFVEQAINAPDTAMFVSGSSSLQLSNTAVPHTVTGPNGSFSFDDVYMRVRFTEGKRLT